MPNPFEADISYKEGLRCLKSGEFEAAYAHFDSLVKDWPFVPDVWACRALALGHLQRYLESLDSFDRALEFNPDDERIWFNRGIVLRDWGKVEKALLSFERAIKINRKCYQSWG